MMQMTQKNQILEQYVNKLEMQSLAHLAEVQKRIVENIKIEIRSKTVTQSNLILGALRNHFIFYNLSQMEVQGLLKKVKTLKIKCTKIYDTTDNATCFFIVQKGSLELTGEDHSKKKLIKPNDGFGQLALLYNTPRNSSVVALQDSYLWVIDRLTFRQAVQEMIIRQYTENKRLFQNVRFFSNLTNDQKDIICSSLIKQKFYKGQNLIQEGDPGSTFYYIKEGNASVYKASKFQRKLTKGDSFGEQSLYYNTMRQYTITADDDVLCLVLGRDTLNGIMGDNVYQVTFKNFIRWAFEKNSSISQFSKQNQERIIEEMKIHSYKAQQSIFKRGVVGFQKIVVVIEGSLKKIKNGVIVASKGQCFGQEFLNDQMKFLDDEIVMQNYGVLAQISDTAFYKAVGTSDIKVLMQQRKKQNNKILQKMEIKNIHKALLNDVDIRQLNVRSILSAQGQFGPIYELTYLQKNYILKVIEKSSLKKYDVEKFAIEQGRVLQEISCPFIIAMAKKFQSPNYAYYLHQYVKGDDFYSILKTIGLLSTQDCLFYTATIILILEYFAEKGIICRDIKPQNFMVDSSGYLKLINLPTAKKLGQESSENLKKTFTIIGTPHYMAPDIVIGKGYNNMADLWSLGVCLYQFFCGILPYGDESESAYQIYEEIMQVQLKFPQFLIDKKAKRFIQQLLSHNPINRLGGSFQKLKSHPWFDNFKWNYLIERNAAGLKPPALPQRKSKQAKEINLSIKQLIARLQKDKPPSKITQQWSKFSQIIL